MRGEIVDEGERLVARPAGRLEAADGDEFASTVEQRLLPGTRSVTIDLADVNFISLGAIRSVLRLARSLKRDQRTLEFAQGSDAVREALHQAGMNNFFPFSPPYHPHRGT